MIDDDPDPIDEIRAVRAARMRKFKTLDAYVAYLQTLPMTVDGMLAHLREEDAKKKAPLCAFSTSKGKRRRSKVKV